MKRILRETLAISIITNNAIGCGYLSGIFFDTIISSVFVLLPPNSIHCWHFQKQIIH